MPAVTPALALLILSRIALSEVSPSAMSMVTGVVPDLALKPVGGEPPVQLPSSIVSEPADSVALLLANTALLSVCVVARALTCSECEPAAPFLPLSEVTVATEASETVVLVCPHSEVELKAAALSRSDDRPLWILPNDEIFALIEVSALCMVLSG